MKALVPVTQPLGASDDMMACTCLMSAQKDVKNSITGSNGDDVADADGDGIAKLQQPEPRYAGPLKPKGADDFII